MKKHGGWSKVNWTLQNMYLLFTFHFLHYVKVFFFFFFSLFTFWGHDPDLYLISMAREIPVQFWSIWLEWSWLALKSNRCERGRRSGMERKWNEMKRYTPKELQSIVCKHVQPSRQQETQKIAKGKKNIDREIMHRPARRYLSSKELSLAQRPRRRRWDWRVS